MTANNKTEYGFDPTEEHELVDERTPIEIYWETEGEVPQYAQEAIVYLERELFKARAEIKNLKQPKTSLSKSDLLNLTQPRLNG